MSTWTPATKDLDPQNLTIELEYVRAYNERAALAFWAVIAEPIEGDEVHWASWWKYLQERVEIMASGWWGFLNSHVYPGGFEGVEYGTNIMYTLATWKTAAGLPSGWRRVPLGTAWPTDWTDYSDPSYSYGMAVDGDIKGPWILADLQAGLKQFRWMVASYSTFTANGEQTLAEGVAYYKASFALAKAAAEADFVESGSYDGPVARADTWYHGDPPDNANAFMERSYGYQTWNSWGKGGGLNKDVDFYTAADKYPDSDWDGNGDFPAGYTLNTRHLWHTEAGVGGTSGITPVALGNHTVPPNWPAADPGSCGYIAGGSHYTFAVLRYDVAGGFEYQ